MEFSEAAHRISPVIFDETLSAQDIQTALNEVLASYGVSLTKKEAEHFQQRVLDQITNDIRQHLEAIKQQT